MRERIIAGNIYHILNRGVDKRKIFLENLDYLRFVHNLFEFNDRESVSNNTYYFATKGFASPNIDRKPRKLLVEVLVFCLMPNHYHLLIRPLSDDGVLKFIRKINMGYANYFNAKYERKGALFQGRYKLVLVAEESHFVHLPYYIHCNPLDLKFPEWRDYGFRKPINWKKAIKFLEDYRWSSFLDYIGRKNFPSVTQREFLMEFFGGSEQYKKDTAKWLKGMNLKEIKELTLE